MLISGGRRHPAKVQENRLLVLAVTSGCTLAELFSTLPPFLVGRMIGKHLLCAFIFYSISQFLGIEGCYNLFYFINGIDYSVKLPF